MRLLYVVLRVLLLLGALAVLVGTWLPVVHSEPPATRPPPHPNRRLFPTILALLSIGTIVWAAPLGRIGRVVIALVLAGATAAAWIAEGHVRAFLGSPFTP